MSSEDAGYYAVIPASVRYDEKLIPNAKLLYGEITALCKKQGYCWATNDYFATLYKTSDKTIGRWIKSLVDRKYVYTKIKTFRYADGTIKKMRYIGLDKNWLLELDKIEFDHTDKNVPDHTDKNVPYINTRMNNTSLMDTNVSIGEVSPETYGKVEINQLFDSWESLTGLPITSNRTKNRYACNNLIGKYGVDGVEKLIRVVERAQIDKYAPRIADFCDLQAKLNQLLVWAKGQATNKQVISVEDF